MSDVGAIAEIRAAAAEWHCGEPAFHYEQALAALGACTEHAIAVLGVEVLRPEHGAYEVVTYSSYDAGETGRGLQALRDTHGWPAYVSRNNALAEGFIRAETRPRPFLYLLTTASREEAEPGAPAGRHGT